MRKFKRPTNIRIPVLGIQGRYSVLDRWPPRSYSGKYILNVLVETSVQDGDVYVEEFTPTKGVVTAIHHPGETFTQDPGVIYAIGSVCGAKTTSCSDGPIDPMFIPKSDEDE